MTRNVMIRVMMGVVMVGMLWWGEQHALAQEKKLVIWSHWQEEPVKINFMNAVIAEFSKVSGIPVEIVWTTSRELMETLPLALDNNEPDITYIDESFTHPRIGRALGDLRDIEFTGQIHPTWSLRGLGGNENRYFPIEGITNGIYYNKDVLNKAHIELPADRPLTADEFLTLIKTLRAAGITPIGEGSSDATIKMGLPIINTIFRYAGPEKIAQLYAGELTFADPDVRAALTFWKQVIDAQGYDLQKAIDLTLSEGIFEVTDGQAALSFCGTYFYSKYGMTDRDHGQIGVLDWFTVPNGKGNGYYEIFWGAGFGINAKSAHIAEAKQLLAYLMSPEASSLWMKYVQTPYPVTAGEVDPSSLYSMLLAQRSGQQPSPVLFSYIPFPLKATQQMWELETRKFITGEHTVEQFIERMNSRLQ